MATQAMVKAAILAVSGLLAAGLARAEILTLSPQGETASVVRSADSGSGTGSGISVAQNRLLIQAGALAADPAHDLVYAALWADPLNAGPPIAVSQIVAGRYGSHPAPAGSVEAPSGMRFQALAFDAPSASLVGLVSSLNAAQAFSVSTSAGTAFGTPTFLPLVVGCCRFVSGVSAWRAATSELFVLGWRDTDSAVQLLRIALTPGSATLSAYPLGGDRVSAMAVDAVDGQLYALARSTLGATYLAAVGYSAPDAPVTLTAIGSTPASCCYSALGPAVIDGNVGARAMYVLTRDAQTPVDMQLMRLPLASGEAQIVNANIRGFGLWADAAVTFDVIFADGFD